MLAQLRSVQFEVWPLNAHQTSRDAAADYAAKPTLGRLPSREFVGEGDEKVTISGRVFPKKFGGLDGLQALDALRRSGVAQLLMRGDGQVMGWFVIETVRERADRLAADGVGRVIEFDVGLARADVPSAARFVASLF